MVVFVHSNSLDYFVFSESIVVFVSICIRFGITTFFVRLVTFDCCNSLVWFYSIFCVLCFVFFFKQKTAYEMRISDWSSDVCSSDLDLAKACILAATTGAEGIFHISGEDMFAIHELVAAVADFWKLDKSLIQQVSSTTLSQAAPRPARTGFVLDKARHELGYAPHSFTEGLAIVDQQLVK